MNRDRNTKRRRCGFTLLEVIISGTLLGAVLIVSAQMVWSIARQREAILDRQMALAEASNAMERLFVRSWEELTEEAAKDVRLSDDFEQSLSGGKLSIEIGTLPDDLAAKRILVKVSWMHEPGQPVRSVQLVALRYRGEQAEDKDWTEGKG